MFSTIINKETGFTWHGFLLENHHPDYFVFGVVDENRPRIWQCWREVWVLKV